MLFHILLDLGTCNDCTTLVLFKLWRAD